MKLNKKNFSWLVFMFAHMNISVFPCGLYMKCDVNYASGGEGYHITLVICSNDGCLNKEK